MSFWKQHARSLMVLAVIAIGILINSPYINYQNYLSQGDHGRDLYAAEAVYRGELPYKDFWWVYGPLTPYYYGLFFKIFGVHITSMILGKLTLCIAAGVLICLGLMEIASPLCAFFCACWFMLFREDFFFTYNHAAGIVMVAGVAFCLLRLIQRNSINALWMLLGFIFLLCLIKLNFGATAIVVSAITVAVNDAVKHTRIDISRKIFYTSILLLIPLISFFIYWSLLKGLSPMEIRQCLPYKEGDQPYDSSVWISLGYFFQITWQIITSNLPNLSLAVIINISLVRCLYLWSWQKISKAQGTILLLAFCMLGLFYLLNTHEYIKSAVWYRILWAQPLSTMISFLLIDTAAQSWSTSARKFIFSIVGLMLILGFIDTMININNTKTDSQYLALPRAQVYVANAPSWITTVQQTTTYLQQTLKPNELFFALPYDCLYYYLTGKRTPTRQLIFFEHIKIPPEQERSVIAELERNHVNYVLLSNRAYVLHEHGLGFLGTTYCPIIGKYIQDNFTPIARFGDWTDEAGWSWNHGTLILKRKST